MEFDTFFSKVDESAAFIKDKISIEPKLLVVLTGGLNQYVDELSEKITFSSADIPNFPKTKVEGHAGKIIFGKYKDVPLVAMQGRYHYYEGHTPQAVVFPYFVFGKLGVKSVVTTNAVGGINKSFKAGDLVVVKDHINMMGNNPLIGVAMQRPTDQFTSMTDAYNEDLRKIAARVAKNVGIKIKEGTYVGVTGPSYDTKAEVKAFRNMGADTIGMSTIFEVITLNFLNIKVLTINCVANPAADLHGGTMRHEEVLAAINKAQPQLLKLLQAITLEIPC